MADFNDLPTVVSEEPLDLRLPFADQYDGEPPVRDLAELLFIGDSFEVANTGRIPVRHDWRQISISFVRGQPNKATYALIVHASDVKYVLPFIVGTAKISDDFPWRLSRLMPVMDPDGLGLFATNILNVQYMLPNGLIALETRPDNIVPGLKPEEAQPDFYLPGSVWNNSYSIFVGPYNSFDPEAIPEYEAFLQRKVAKQFRYAVITVEFEHKRFPVLTDDRLADEDDERWRWCTATYTTSNEYINFQPGQMFWRPYRCADGDKYDDNPMPPQDEVRDSSGNPRAVNNTATQIRLTGEIKIVWEDVPGDAIAQLWPQWTGLDFTDEQFCRAIDLGNKCIAEPSIDLAANTGLTGKCNRACFDLPIRSLATQTTVMRCPPQTLLFNAPHLIDKTDVRGFLFCDVIITLSVRREGWNKFFNARRGEYWRAMVGRRDGSGSGPVNGMREIYAPVDFAQIFEIPT